MKASHIVALPLAVSIVGMIAVPNYAQKAPKVSQSKATAAKRAAKMAAIRNVDTRAISPDGTHGAQWSGEEGGIAGAPFQNWTFESPLFIGSPATAVSGQNGFTSFQGCTGSLNTPTPVVTTAGTPMNGSQWITVPKGPCPAGAFAGPFSPTSAPQVAGAYTGTVNLRINDVQGADYDVVFQSTTVGNLVSRVKFYYGDFDPDGAGPLTGDGLPGDILVVTDVDGTGPLGASFVDSGVDYVQGALTAIKVEVDGPGNSLKYYINNALVGSSQLIFSDPLTGGNGSSGDRIDQFVGISDNFQLNAIDNGQFDDVVMEPGIGAPCIGDVNGDNQINVADLLSVISSWGPCAGCPADVNGDNQVNVADLLTVISEWGPC